MTDGPSMPAERWTISPELFRRVAGISFVALALIVFTGSAVRLTGSGLGCPDWPRCEGRLLAPLETHAWIEYGNRIISGFVALSAVLTGILGWRRRPFRRELAVLGVLLPLGVVMQAGLGALTVVYDLKPGFVMSHYLLSMLILDAAFALWWCARYESGERRRSWDRLGVWAVRALLPLGSLTIIAGTAATASGPHAGGAGTGDVIDRLNFRGEETLHWVVQRHGALAVILGLAVIGTFLLLRRAGGDDRAATPVAVAGCLLAAQGALGIVQYALELPGELVWVHVVLAVATWVSLLWSVARAGRLGLDREPVAADGQLDPAVEEREELLADQLPAPA